MKTLLLITLMVFFSIVCFGDQIDYRLESEKIVNCVMKKHYYRVFKKETERSFNTSYGNALFTIMIMAEIAARDDMEEFYGILEAFIKICESEDIINRSLSDANPTPQD